MNEQLVQFGEDHVEFDHFLLLLGKVLLLNAYRFYLLVNTPFLQKLDILNVITLSDLFSIFCCLFLMVLLEEWMIEYVFGKSLLVVLSGLDLCFQILLLGEHFLIVRISLWNQIANLLHAQCLFLKARWHFANVQAALVLLLQF